MPQSSHNHNFLLKSAKHPYYCQRCNQVGFGMCYSCDNSECNLFHHEQCQDPKSLVKHPFSTKSCTFKFYKNGYGKKDCLCDVCGNNIKGHHAHYRCSCNFVKRNAHPSCLGYEPTLAAIDGLTMKLQKVATAKCLHCETKDLSSKVHGWAYVSTCGEYCYHVICVINIINENWQNGFMKGTSDPFQIIKERFPADKNKMNKIVIGKKSELKKKKVQMALSVIFNLMTGNPMGLVGDAKSFFSKG